MKYLLNHTEMKAVDMYSIHTIGIPSLVLMERAALSVVRRMLERITKKDKILAVSGSGNNGADAVAAARILHNMGYDACVYLAADADHISGELKVQIDIVNNQNIKVYGKDDIRWESFDWIIDGVFGIGLSREVQGRYAEVISKINEASGKVCAVDIPSGIFADNGQVLGCAVKADMTVTFGFDKAGMILYPGASYAGDLYVEDIGFAIDSVDFVTPHLQCLEDEDIKAILPKRYPWSNKGSYGKLLVVAGKKNMCGAAYLCGKAAYKTGVGLVKIITPEENRTIIQTSIPEAVLDTYNEDMPDENWIKAQMQWADAIVVGPGLGITKAGEVFVRCALKQTKPVLIDADGLNILAKHKEWLEQKTCPLIITPHLGEMSRLTQKSIKEIQDSLIETCEQFAEAYDLICVLKDARTITSDGRNVTFVNTSGNNGMSTGGSGDVLSGIIGGLMCQKDMQTQMCTMAAAGVFIHGRSGDEAKKVTGVYGLLASDIIKYISNIVND